MERYKAILYSRVSTVNDEQSESIDNQILLAENFLSKHPEIELVEPLGTFSEKVSGKNDDRAGFQGLIDRLSQGDIDYLLVKDMKRLTRSVEVSYVILHLMEDYGFKIYQLASGKILDAKSYEETESALLLTLEAAFAEATVRTQSKYGRTVQRLRVENKTLTSKDVVFGYVWNKEKKEIEIDPVKADVIRNIYDRYVFANEGIYEIRKYLSSLGYNYSSNTVSKWLQESKYVGDFIINKRGTKLGIGSGKKSKRFMRPENEWVHVDRPDLAIIERPIFDLALKMRKRRTELAQPDKNGNVQARFKGHHLFSGKLYCGWCNHAYVHGYSDRKETIGIYRDTYNRQVKDATKRCENVDYKVVYEDDIKNIVGTAITGVVNEGKKGIPKLLETIESVLLDNTANDKRQAEIKKDIARLDKEAYKIMESFIEADHDMKLMLNQKLSSVKLKISELEDERTKILNMKDDVGEVKAKISQIDTALDKWRSYDGSTVTRDMVNAFIDKIIVDKSGKIDVHLNSAGVIHSKLPEPRNKKTKKKEENQDDTTTGSPLSLYSHNKNQVKNIMEVINKQNKRTLKILGFTYTIRSRGHGRKTKERDAYIEVFMNIE